MTTQTAFPIRIIVNESGVFIQPVSQARPPKKVSNAIAVGDLITTEGTTGKLIEIRFFDRNRDLVKLQMLPSEFEDFRQFKRLLLDHGYKFPTDPAITQMLHSNLVAQPPKQHRHIIHRQGWYGSHFVFPGEPTRIEDRLVCFEPVNPEHARNFGSGGTLQGWQDGVGKHARHSTRLALSISLAFGTALLEFTDVENGGIHLYEESTVGKTTFMLAAASVSGRAERNKLYLWDHTKTGLDDLATAHNGTLLCLDEILRAEDVTAAGARIIRDATFRLSGGSGKIYSTAYKKKMGQQSVTWRILFLSTGEYSLSKIARMNLLEQLKGQQVRFIDVPALVHDRHKGYESLPSEYDNSAALAKAIEANCRKHYGVALREFVKCVARDMVTIRSDIAAEMNKFLAGARVPEDGWEQRFAKRFALAYAAAKLAIKYGIVPWDGKMAAHAIKSCYMAARAVVPDADKLRISGLARLRAKLSDSTIILDLARSGHHVPWTPEQAQAAGVFRHPGSGNAYFLIVPETFFAWFESLTEANLTLDALERGGYLVKSDPNVKTLQAAIKGIKGRPRYYAVREVVLSSTWQDRTVEEGTSTN